METKSITFSNLSVYSNSDVGRVRKLNEDYFENVQLKDDLFLSIVADGVGGLISGETASLIASTVFSSTLLNELINQFNGRVIFGNNPFFNENVDFIICESIRKAVYAANQSVKKIVTESGTTLVATLILLNLGVAYIINVGDSRAYIIDSSKREINQITRDHSNAWVEFEKNIIPKFDFNRDNYLDLLKEFSELKRLYLIKHPKSHVIWNVIGYFDDVERIDITRLDLTKGDKILLATDGLTDLVNDYDILNVVLEYNNEYMAVEKLIETANVKGGHDNITVTLLNVNG